jgi:hypothetical protein
MERGKADVDTAVLAVSGRGGERERVERQKP